MSCFSFCFVKQKTAYEMRISDWSSDVCSSDLLASTAKSNAAYAAFNAARRDVEQHGSQPVPMHIRNAPTRLMKQLGHGKGYQYEIGRASCRERLCQYV